MTAVRFNLKRPSANISAIECVLTDGRDVRFRLATGISVKPKHWSKTKSTRKILSADPNCESHNDFLWGNKNRVDLAKNADTVTVEGFGPKVVRLYLEAKDKGVLPDTQYFYAAMEAKELENDFWGHWEAFILSKGAIFKKNTFKKYKSLKAHLQQFETDVLKKSKRSFDLDKITVSVLEEFQGFLYRDAKGRLGLNTQSTEKYISIFKIFLSWCVKRKYSKNEDFRNFTPLSQPEGLKIIMSDDELSQIRNLELGSKKYLKNVRSLFLLACGTGLRFSDFTRIGAPHLKLTDEGPELVIRQEKTQEFVEIPLSKECHGIVECLIEGSVKPISNQKMNAYVKELCQLAGIDEGFEVHKWKGSEKTTTIVPKYELVSTHTGRRTYATKLLNGGMPAEAVMEFTGHTDYKSFAKYVNIPKKTKKQMVRQALEGNMKVA